MISAQYGLIHLPILYGSGLHGNIWGPFTTVDYFYFQYGQVITPIKKFGMELIMHSQTSSLHLEVWEWISKMIQHFTAYVIT